MNRSEKIQTDVLVLGSGLAGLTAALNLADHGLDCTLVTKAKRPDVCNTAWAQGGIAWEPKEPDTFIEDIWNAGVAQGHRPAIDLLVRQGSSWVQSFLIDRFKVPFERNDSGVFKLATEAAHRKPRVLFNGDQTGEAIHRILLNAALEHSSITILDNHTAIDLLTTEHHAKGLAHRYQLENRCMGAYVLDNTAEQVKTIAARFTVLATGGLGGLYLHHTNTKESTGDGLAMAHRAGASMLFPHYVQFHPTTLAKGKRRFLISEAVRGAGAILLNHEGRRFMLDHSDQGELAPRDEVSRAITHELLVTGEDAVLLDLSTIPSSEGPLEKRFPRIFHACQNVGIDMRKEPIPIVPGAHYLCGGIKVDLDGRTTLKSLYAIGETACTGVHGANRLASTSLLECLTWGMQAAHHIASASDLADDFLTVSKDLRPWTYSGKTTTLDLQRVSGDWDRIRTVMWNYVGVVRSEKLLDIAVKEFQLMYESFKGLYFDVEVSRDLVDLFHGIQTARLIAHSALKDRQSLGCHHLSDA